MTQVSKALSESLEDYLEAIYHIVGQKGAARAKDIADRLGVTNASVTGALHSLAEKELINYVPYDVITLTSGGEEIARAVVERHEMLFDFFRNVLHVDEGVAQECACRMEHAMPDSVRVSFADFIEEVKSSK